MDLEKTVDVLRNSAIFSGWERAELARLVPYLSTREIEPGRLLCLRGESADTLYILLEGSARVRSGNDSLLLAPGGDHDCAGQEAAFGAASARR